MLQTPTIPGYEVTGPAGWGASGATWVVRTTGGRLRDGKPRVAAVVEKDGRVARLRELGLLQHPNLPAIDDVVAVGEDRVAVVMGLVIGPSLATLLNARPWLDAGEIVALWRGVGDALAALHRRGLVHGDVSPANVVITPEGTPVLVDVVGHRGHEVGHVGYVPPEVLDGAVPTASSDVWSLARTLAWAAGEDAAVHRALGAALGDVPALRPDSARFHTMAFLLGHPQAIRAPAGSDLAGAQLRARTTPTVVAVTGQQPRRRLLRWLGAVAVLAVAAGLSLALADGARSAAPDATQAAATGAPRGYRGPGLAGAELRAAVTGVVAARDAALAGRDEAALAALYTPGTPALATDRALLGELEASGVRLLGYRTAVGEVTAVEASPARLVVEAALTQGQHTRTSPDGTQRIVPAQAERCVRLTLRGAGTSRQVEGMAPCG